ncbi:MAG: GntR family transcriptional regulator [Desulfobacteraceae bacterium]|nr:GntR family transcriptional regulator [Desulfobacteraceae bacterium]
MQNPAPKEAIPLYSRVATMIRHKILSGQYRPGQRLPTEDELVESYGVSRITIRGAMAILETNGLINRTRGRGTFVAEVIPETPITIHTSLNEVMLSIAVGQTKPLEIKTLPISETRIPKDIHKFFGAADSEKICRIRRLFTHKNISSVLENYMPLDIAKHITKKELAQKKSVQMILKEKIGLKVTKGEMYLQAIAADHDLSDILRCQAFEPLIQIQTFFWYESMKPFEIVNRYYRASNFKYKMDLDIS